MGKREGKEKDLLLLLKNFKKNPHLFLISSLSFPHLFQKSVYNK
jgi:hypothetical protein